METQEKRNVESVVKSTRVLNALAKNNGNI
jgi:hypothetical protein